MVASVLVMMVKERKRGSDWTLVCIYVDRILDMDWKIRRF